MNGVQSPSSNAKGRDRGAWSESSKGPGEPHTLSAQSSPAPLGTRWMHLLTTDYGLLNSVTTGHLLSVFRHTRRSWSSEESRGGVGLDLDMRLGILERNYRIYLISSG